jgi:hypothetical protein
LDHATIGKKSHRLHDRLDNEIDRRCARLRGYRLTHSAARTIPSICILERILASISAKPRFAVECDSVSLVILEVEAGRGVVLANTILRIFHALIDADFQTGNLFKVVVWMRAK